MYRSERARIEMTRLDRYAPLFELELDDDVTPVVSADHLARREPVRRALVVDDDPALRRAATRILGRAGYEVLEACDGDAAIRLIDLSDHTLDLIVTDINMPGQASGYDVVAHARLRAPNTATLLTSSLPDAELSAACGAPFLWKPYTAAALVRAAHEALGLR